MLFAIVAVYLAVPILSLINSLVWCKRMILGGIAAMIVCIAAAAVLPFAAFGTTDIHYIIPVCIAGILGLIIGGISSAFRQHKAK